MIGKRLDSRRSFLKQAGAAGVAVPLLARNLMSAPPSNRIRHASFGAAGMAGGDMLQFANLPNVQLVCVAEVDLGRMDILKKYVGSSNVKVYQDWREMLDKEQKNLDSVNVGTPDHMHAPMAMSAMQLGLHAYVQKPLAHDIYEVRRLTELAREKKLVTQMGIQIHTSAYYRIGVKVIQSGAIGKVKEVHSWSCKKWGDLAPLPTKSDPVPSTLNWDLWLGVCASLSDLSSSRLLPPGQLAQAAGFRHRHLRRHGLPHLRPGLRRPGPDRPDLAPLRRARRRTKWNWSINSVIHYVFPGTRVLAKARP